MNEVNGRLAIHRTTILRHRRASRANKRRPVLYWLQSDGRPRRRVHLWYRQWMVDLVSKNKILLVLTYLWFWSRRRWRAAWRVATGEGNGPSCSDGPCESSKFHWTIRPDRVPPSLPRSSHCCDNAAVSTSLDKNITFITHESIQSERSHFLLLLLSSSIFKKSKDERTEKSKKLELVFVSIG